MRLAVCGSLTFHNELRAAARTLESLGYIAIVPKSLALIEHEGYIKPVTVQERLIAEARYDFIREHFKHIESSDAILVVNPNHNDIEGYIGGNTFLEMGIAFYLGKPIYLLYAIPHMSYELELASMHPILIQGDLSKIVQFSPHP